MKAKDVVLWLIHEERKQVLDSEIRLLVDNPTSYSYIIRALEGTGILKRIAENRRIGVRVYEVDYAKIVRYYPHLAEQIPDWAKEQVEKSKESPTVLDEEARKILEAQPVLPGQEEQRGEEA